VGRGGRRRRGRRRLRRRDRRRLCMSGTAGLRQPGGALVFLGPLSGTVAADGADAAVVGSADGDLAGRRSPGRVTSTTTGSATSWSVPLGRPARASRRRRLRRAGPDHDLGGAGGGRRDPAGESAEDRAACRREPRRPATATATMTSACGRAGATARSTRRGQRTCSSAGSRAPSTSPTPTSRCMATRKGCCWPPPGGGRGHGRRRVPDVALSATGTSDLMVGEGAVFLVAGGPSMSSTSPMPSRALRRNGLRRGRIGRGGAGDVTATVTPTWSWEPRTPIPPGWTTAASRRWCTARSRRRRP